MKHVLVALLGIGIAVVGPAALAQTAAPTAAECDAWFAKADTNADGKLNSGENTVFVDAINKSATTKLDAGADLDKTAFADACLMKTLHQGNFSWGGLLAAP
jgi:hypothetical protein